MILEDLVAHLPQNSVISAIRTKLHRTLVKYNGEWAYIETNLLDDESVYYGSGYSWVHIHTHNREVGGFDTHKQNTIEGIDTEPSWPDAGYYYHKGKTISLKYNISKAYKAGLPLVVFTIYNDMDTKIIAVDEQLAILNSIDQMNEYLSIKEAVEILKNKVTKKIAISKQLYIEAHPYINGPVITFKALAIAIITKDYKIQLPENNMQLKEMLEDVGEIMSHA